MMKKINVTNNIISVLSNAFISIFIHVDRVRGLLLPQ